MQQSISEVINSHHFRVKDMRSLLRTFVTILLLGSGSVSAVL